MPTTDEIRKDRKACLRVIDALMFEAGRRLNDGDASMQAKIDALQAARNRLQTAALDAILASPELANALKVMARVAENLEDVADDMVLATKVTTKFAEVLGMAQTVITEVQNTFGP